MATIGEGAPLVYTPNVPWSHIQLEWQLLPEARAWYESLAQRRKLVLYDGRGSGQSERDALDFSLEAQLLDLEAVVDCLRLDSFALAGIADSGPAAITYAVRHPERVSHLILWCTYASVSDQLKEPEVAAYAALVDKDWRFFTDTAAHSALAWVGGDLANRFAEWVRESTSQQAVQAAWRAQEGYAVTALLSEVQSPTLVLHRRQLRELSSDVARRLASQIPNARLALLEGKSWVPFAGDIEAALRAIYEFLGEDVPPAEMGQASSFRTVLITDVEGSTALTQRLGDAKARELLREHERMVREALKAHGGSEVKTMGDGFMASFSSATKALECAIVMQRAFAEHNESAEEPILVRIGLNAGEPIAEDDPDGRSDLFGTAVNLAARIAAKAEGAEILTSDTVRGLVAGKKFLFADRGEASLKGFDESVRLFEVRWRE